MSWNPPSESSWLVAIKLRTEVYTVTFIDKCNAQTPSRYVSQYYCTRTLSLQSDWHTLLSCRCSDGGGGCSLVLCIWPGVTINSERHLCCQLLGHDGQVRRQGHWKRSFYFTNDGSGKGIYYWNLVWSNVQHLQQFCLRFKSVLNGRKVGRTRCSRLFLSKPPEILDRWDDSGKSSAGLAPSCEPANNAFHLQPHLYTAIGPVSPRTRPRHDLATLASSETSFGCRLRVEALVVLILVLWGQIFLAQSVF